MVALNIKSIQPYILEKSHFSSTYLKKSMVDLLDNYDRIEARYFLSPRKLTTKSLDFLQKVHLSLSQLVYMLNNANESISDLCFWHNKSYLSLFPAALFLCFLGRNHMADIHLTFLLPWYVKFFLFFCYHSLYIQLE